MLSCSCWPSRVNCATQMCDLAALRRHVVTIDGHEDVPENSEADLAKAVANQPVSVAICADSLQFYSSGVVSKCCTGLDHGVLLVGYDTVRALV